MKTLSEIQAEVGEWSRQNFGEQVSKHDGTVLGAAAPLMGAVEECGELMHCILKRHQGIRGFDDPEKFRKESRDALGDIGIYLMDAVERAGYGILNYSPIIETVQHSLSCGEDNSVDKSVRRLSYLCSKLAYRFHKRPHSSGIDECLDGLEFACRALGTTMHEVISETWENVVSKRSWVKS